MIDISPVLRRLRHHRGHWSRSQAAELVSELAGLLGATVDWDTFAGEDWASLSVGEVWSAMVSAQVPLVIAKRELTPWPSACGATPEVIVVPDFRTEVLSCDEELLSAVLGFEHLPLADMDASAFSVIDLWFATI